MSTLTEAFGDGFRKHPIIISFLGVTLIASVVDSLVSPFNDHSLPTTMTCELATQNAVIRRGETLIETTSPSAAGKAYLVCKP